MQQGFRFARGGEIADLRLGLFVRRAWCGGSEFLEAGIIPQRIEHRIEPEQRGRKRDAHTTKTAAWYREKFLSRRDSAVRLSCLCYHADEELERSRTVERIFLKRARGRGFLGESQCSGLVTESNIGKGHITDELVIIRLFFEKRFQFVARLSPTFLGGGVLAAHFLRPA